MKDTVLSLSTLCFVFLSAYQSRWLRCISSKHNFSWFSLEFFKALSDKHLNDHGLQLTSYGPDGSIILLRHCLEQVNLAEKDQNLQVKLDLLAFVIRSLIHEPNLGTVLCEALRNLPSVSEEFLANLCRALKLSLPEQIALGLALTDAEDIGQRQQGECAPHGSS